MLTKSFRVESPMGLHTRAAAILVAQTAKFDSSITVRYRDAEANGKSIISLIALQVSKGEPIEISVSGTDEEKAMQRLDHFFDEDIKRCG